jgi:hypothetical protein
LTLLAGLLPEWVVLGDDQLELGSSPLTHGLVGVALLGYRVKDVRVFDSFESGEGHLGLRAVGRDALEDRGVDHPTEGLLAKRGVVRFGDDLGKALFFGEPCQRGLADVRVVSPNRNPDDVLGPVEL